MIGIDERLFRARSRIGAGVIPLVESTMLVRVTLVTSQKQRPIQIHKRRVRGYIYSRRRYHRLACEQWRNQ